MNMTDIRATLQTLIRFCGEHHYALVCAVVGALMAIACAFFALGVYEVRHESLDTATGRKYNKR